MHVITTTTTTTTTTTILVDITNLRSCMKLELLQQRLLARAKKDVQLQSLAVLRDTHGYLLSKFTIGESVFSNCVCVLP